MPAGHPANHAVKALRARSERVKFVQMVARHRLIVLRVWSVEHEQPESMAYANRVRLENSLVKIAPHVSVAQQGR